MRFIAMLSTVTVAFLALAGSAQAVDFFFVTTAGSPDPGSNLTLELWCDPDGTDLQAWFLNVDHQGNTSNAAVGEPFIFVGGVLASPLGVVAPGANVSAQWAYTVSPPAFIPGATAPFKYGQLTFDNLSNGLIEIVVAPGGAVGGPMGVDLVLAGLVTFDSIQVPEPNVAVLGFASLAALGLLKRVRRSA